MTAEETRDRPRARMVRSAARMIRERGVNGVGLRQIAADADGSRGSLQRFFPGGKTQVLLESLDVALDDFGTGTRLAFTDATDLSEAIHMIVESWRHVLVSSDYTSGCPLAALVVDVSAVDPLREAADGRFTRWRGAIAAIYRRFGWERDPAWEEAMLVIASIEGAALVARAARSTEPLDAVERLLKQRADSV